MADSLHTPHIVPVLEGSRPKLLEEVRHTVRMPALQPADGVLGHSDLSTTMTYLYVLGRGALGVKSPLNRL